MSLQILIVEDEILTAETIKMYLEEQGHQVLGICISYEEALAAYESQLPDMVILDIRLYGQKSGIDFAHFLQEQEKKTVFIYLTSQHDRRIFDLALETTPYGYLSKPIQKESLCATVETAYRLYQKGTPPTVVLTLFDGQKKHRVNEREILCVRSEHVYSNVHLIDGRKIMTRKPLSQFLQHIKPKLLFQCHRSFIINTLHINGWDNNTVTLSNGEVVPVSRSKKALLSNLLQRHD